MNTHDHTPHTPTATTASPLDWPAPEPMGADLRRRRDEMLVHLRGEVVARHRRRTTAKALMAAVVLLAAAGTLRALTRVAPAGPAPIAKADPAPAPSTPAPATPVSRPMIAIIPTDPAVVSRLAAPAGESRITIVDDQGVLPLLERLGSPGLIRVDGRVILSRDLGRPAEADAPAPQSLAPAGEPTHG